MEKGLNYRDFSIFLLNSCSKKEAFQILRTIEDALEIADRGHRSLLPLKQRTREVMQRLDKLVA